MADETLSQELLDVLQQATHQRLIKKGANEGELNPFLSVVLALTNASLSLQPPSP